MRAMVSELLPAWNGTIRRIGRSVGQVWVWVWAWAVPDHIAAATRATRRFAGLLHIDGSRRGCHPRIPLCSMRATKLSKRHARRQLWPIASGDLICLAQALEQRGAEQEGARE